MDMTMESCRKFVEVLASDAPAPGGGGAAALVGAIGTALGNMVGSLTVGKKKYADVEAEIIALHGSIELAPLVGLAECIIDLTATGTTLRENDLVVLDEISTSTARLISNRGSYRLRHSEVVALADAMQGSGELFG